MTKALDEFMKYWADRVRKGEVSDFDRIELMDLVIYTQWLKDNRYLIDSQNDYLDNDGEGVG